MKDESKADPFSLPEFLNCNRKLLMTINTKQASLMKNVMAVSIQQDGHGHEQCPSLECNLHFNDRERERGFHMKMARVFFFWGGGVSSVKGSSFNWHKTHSFKDKMTDAVLLFKKPYMDV